MKTTCNNPGPCCFRDGQLCEILADTHFEDGRCHFRKLRYSGPNEYDKAKKQEMKKAKKDSAAPDPRKWRYAGKAKSAEGSTIYYKADWTGLTIESRTTYTKHGKRFARFHVMRGDLELTVSNTLNEAKNFVDWMEANR